MNVKPDKAKKIVIECIKAYKNFISPLFGNSCRFYPTCSQYAQEAVDKYGVMRGTKKALCRILRCNPFSPGGYDPVEQEEKE